MRSFAKWVELFKEEAPPPPPPPAQTNAPTTNAPPPPSGNNADPLAGGGMGDPSANPAAPTGGKPKIIKINTVWDALESVLGKVKDTKKPEKSIAKSDNKHKSLHK